MNNDRIIDLGEDIRNNVFETLDAEPELTGMDAGKVASIVEEAFVKALQAIMADEPPTSQGGNLVQTPPGSSLVDTIRANAIRDITAIRDNGWDRI